MIGFVLAFVFLFIVLTIPAYVLTSVLRARKLRRQQIRLGVAYDRAVHARKHGLPPLWTGAGLISGRMFRPFELR